MIDDTTNPPTTAFNSEAGLTVLEYWNKLLNEDKVYQLGFEDGLAGDGFKAGKVAMTFNGPWVLEQYKEAGLNFGVIGQPKGPSGDMHAMMGGFGLAIPNKAKHADEAWEFIKWWSHTAGERCRVLQDQRKYAGKQGCSRRSLLRRR